jgi:hypothetical protein
VDHRPAGEGEQRLRASFPFHGRQPVKAILVNRIVDALGKVGLQLGRRDRNAVEQQDKVEAVLMVG